MKDWIKNILLLLVLVVAGYYFQDPLKVAFGIVKNKYFPCQSPIYYSIGTFDERFGLSESEFLKIVGEAEEVWEEPMKSYLDNELLVYKTDGELKINLIYDDRQDATDTLHKMGLVINNTQASYDNLKSKYDSLKDEYQKQKANFETRASRLEQKRKAYEKDVESWNSHGGASGEEYDRLQAQREAINNEVGNLKAIQDSLNQKGVQVNALATNLNKVASALNLKVNTFNKIGQEFAGEFEEGTYRSGPDGTAIDIYQFKDEGKLVRVLAHEFGHALGLEHVENAKAIMYRLNSGENKKLTQDDLNAIKTKCGV